MVTLFSKKFKDTATTKTILIAVVAVVVVVVILQTYIHTYTGA